MIRVHLLIRSFFIYMLIMNAFATRVQQNNLYVRDVQQIIQVQAILHNLFKYVSYRTSKLVNGLWLIIC